MANYKEKETRYDGLEKQIWEKNKKYKVEKMVTEYLIRIGVKSNLKGFQYLKQAISQKVLEPQSVESTTNLYKYIAESNKTTWTRVERAIRDAIEKAWLQGNVEEQQRIFGYTVSKKRGKPTNSEFIAMMLERIKMEL